MIIIYQKNLSTEPLMINYIDNLIIYFINYNSVFFFNEYEVTLLDCKVMIASYINIIISPYS